MTEHYKLLTLCVHIPGPKTTDQPLEKIEEFALKKVDPQIVSDLETQKYLRLIDYTGNYFLVFPLLK